MLSQQMNESIAEISVRRLAIIIQIQIQNWPTLTLNGLNVHYTLQDCDLRSCRQ